MKSFIPVGYQSLLSIYETQKAISLLKRLFEDRLGALLSLYRVSAPLFVAEDSGLNDNLNGVERPVSFDILPFQFIPQTRYTVQLLNITTSAAGRFMQYSTEYGFCSILRFIFPTGYFNTV